MAKPSAPKPPPPPKPPKVPTEHLFLVLNQQQQQDQK